MLIKDLLIPKPLSPKLKFWNKVLRDIYEGISGLISDSQLKTCILEQRISSWKIKDSCSNFIEKVGQTF